MITLKKLSAGLFCCALAIFMLSGCKSLSSFYQGYTSQNPSNTALVNNAAQQGRWETFDLRLDYQAALQDQLLDINGSITFSNFHQINAVHVERLDVYLFFIDAEAKVLRTERISGSQHTSADDSISFAKQLQVPPGAKAISFGYEGITREDGDGGDPFSGGGGGQVWFYQLPRRAS